jgi:hypothetical protein
VGFQNRSLTLFIYLFTVYLTILSVTQIVYHRVVGLLMDDGLKRVWIKVAIAYLNVLLQIFAGRGRGKPRETIA